MRALIFLVAIVLLLALAGWISFSNTPGRSSINIETQKIEQDTDRALESGSNLLRKAGDAVDQANEPALQPCRCRRQPCRLHPFDNRSVAGAGNEKRRRTDESFKSLRRRKDFGLPNGRRRSSRFDYAVNELLLFAAAASLKLLQLVLGFVLGNAVPLLNRAQQLIALAFDLVEIVVGQLAPLFLDLAAELLPLAFGNIPIHRCSPSCKTQTSYAESSRRDVTQPIDRRLRDRSNKCASSMDDVARCSTRACVRRPRHCVASARSSEQSRSD